MGFKCSLVATSKNVLLSAATHIKRFGGKFSVVQLAYWGVPVSFIEAFMRWWNSLANRNGKLKFKTQQEAAEFVRKVQNENGGPNSKIVAMRQKYEEINRAKQQREAQIRSN